MAKKICIFTINDFSNYGNRLQNLALTKMLTKSGYIVLNGFSYYTKKEWVNKSSNFFKRLLKVITPFFVFKKRVTTRRHKNMLLIEKEKNFLTYYQKYCEIGYKIVDRNDKGVLKKLNMLGADYYIVGSDQVWNPNYECFDYEFLTAVPADKRFSFSASIGVSSIGDKAKRKFIDNISSFKYVSVREKSAMNLISELTGFCPYYTYDPTLFLCCDEWNQFLEKPSYCLPSKYICVYFLGELPLFLLNYAKRNNLNIIRLNDLNDPRIFIVNPGEFLYIIKNANIVFTDSFHATIFSIIFHKNFWVFRRIQNNVQDMFTRITSILEEFSLEDRIFNHSSCIEDKISEERFCFIDKQIREKTSVMYKDFIKHLDC